MNMKESGTVLESTVTLLSAKSADSKLVLYLETALIKQVRT